MDVRPGGHWRACMIAEADGTEYPTGGVYHEVVEPERLVFTWADPGDGGEFTEGDSVVTVVLTDLGDKTEMTFHQAGLTTEQGRANVQDGWSQSLDRLAESLS